MQNDIAGQEQELHEKGLAFFGAITASVSHELNNVMQEMTGLPPDELKSRNEDAYHEARRKILELLINDKITQAKVRELGIFVPSTEIDTNIERIKKNNQLTHEDLMRKLKEMGTTYEKYREKIRKDIEKARLINAEVNSKIIIREETLRKYYENHRDKYSIEGSVHIAMIFLAYRNPENEKQKRDVVKRGKGILKRIKDGEDFSELAGKYSQGPGAKNGGDLGVFKTSQIDPELGKQLAGIPEGGVSDLILRKNGVQIIRLTKKKEAMVKPFDSVRDAIFTVLYGDEVDKRYTTWIAELRQRSYIKIIF